MFMLNSSEYIVCKKSGYSGHSNLPHQASPYKIVRVSEADMGKFENELVKKGETAYKLSSCAYAFPHWQSLPYYDFSDNSIVKLEDVVDLNYALERYDDDELLLKDIVDPEDWQAIANIPDASQDIRYNPDAEKLNTQEDIDICDE